jgi:hypothetical protein
MKKVVKSVLIQMKKMGRMGKKEKEVNKEVNEQNHLDGKQKNTKMIQEY